MSPISSNNILKKSTASVTFSLTLLSSIADGINKTAASIQKSPLFRDASIEFLNGNYLYKVQKFNTHKTLLIKFLISIKHTTSNYLKLKTNKNTHAEQTYLLKID